MISIMDSSPTTPQEQELKKNEQHKGRRTFPMLLHEMLTKAEEEGFTDICSWQPHGRAFRIHKHAQFTENIMPRLFRQSKWSSFQRQLNLYGFNRFTANNPDKGAYYHEAFLRGSPQLVKRIERKRVKGTKRRVASNPEKNPDFYTMPSLAEDNCSSNAAASMSSSSSHSREQVVPVVSTAANPVLTNTSNHDVSYDILGQQPPQYNQYYSEFAPPTASTQYHHSNAVAASGGTVITPPITPRTSMNMSYQQQQPLPYPSKSSNEQQDLFADDLHLESMLSTCLPSSSQAAQLNDLCDELDNIFADESSSSSAPPQQQQPHSHDDFNCSMRSMGSTATTTSTRKPHSFSSTAAATSTTTAEIDFILNSNEFNFDLSSMEGGCNFDLMTSTTACAV